MLWSDYRFIWSRVLSASSFSDSQYSKPWYWTLTNTHIIFKGWDSSVSIATRYGLDGPGIESQWGARFSAPVQTGPGSHPASYTMGTGSLSRG